MNAATLAACCVLALVAPAAVSGQDPAAPRLTINGVDADYSTTHLFLDEVAGDAVPLRILFMPGSIRPSQVEVFSNLNRRDRAAMDADGDGIADGVLPPDRNRIVAGDTRQYYRAYPMTAIGSNQFSLTLLATNCGAYRLTARYKNPAGNEWIWLDSTQRDHTIVASPKKARDVVLYELNAMIVDAQGPRPAERSTLADLYDGPGAGACDPVTRRFNLDYVRRLGVNWLWLQPIHPVGVEATVNSPYCVKNYFEVSPLLARANTRAAARAEWKGFVAAADAAGVNVMLDIPFNHTAHDCELAEAGVRRFGGAGNPAHWLPSDEIRFREPRFYSRMNDYGERASSVLNIAVAPDRGDLAKWADVYDVFFGVYSPLVKRFPRDATNYLSQEECFNYSADTGRFDAVTRNVWEYAADVLLYWLDQTGCTNGTPAAASAAGLDGIRADFAEGLPPQAWEYIINKTRTRKWDFVFMAEALGPRNVTFRTSRQFDIVNDNVLFDFRTASRAEDYRRVFDARRSDYGECLILWNSASHDVGAYYSDPCQALIRYLVASTIEGVPMIFYGQELGTRQGFGFSVYQDNPEQVPNFLGHNSLQPILEPTNRTFRLDQLYPLYAAAGRARRLSPALRGPNRRFLDAVGNPQPFLFSVAKFESAGASPARSDVVFAFVNLDPVTRRAVRFNVNIDQDGVNVFGIDPDHLYNLKNLAAYTGADPQRADAWVWNAGVSGGELLAEGLPVSLNAIPSSPEGWSNAPFEAAYLKLYDVTPPASPGPPVPRRDRDMTTTSR